MSPFQCRSRCGHGSSCFDGVQCRRCLQVLLPKSATRTDPRQCRRTGGRAALVAAIASRPFSGEAVARSLPSVTPPVVAPKARATQPGPSVRHGEEQSSSRLELWWMRSAVVGDAPFVDGLCIDRYRVGIGGPDRAVETFALRERWIATIKVPRVHRQSGSAGVCEEMPSRQYKRQRRSDLALDRQRGVSPIGSVRLLTCSPT